MWLWTVQIPGRTRSCFSWMGTICRWLWLAVRQTDFLQSGSFGEIHCTGGIIIRTQGMSGGFPGWSIASGCMMWYGSIIFEDLMSIILFLTAPQRLWTVIGKRDRGWICFHEWRKRWAAGM